VCVVHHRVLAAGQSAGHVKQHLVPVGVHEEVGKAEHPVARRRPPPAMSLDGCPLERR
jgi:hypothetical protein